MPSVSLLNQKPIRQYPLLNPDPIGQKYVVICCEVIPTKPISCRAKRIAIEPEPIGTASLLKPDPWPSNILLYVADVIPTKPIHVDAKRIAMKPRPYWPFNLCQSVRFLEPEPYWTVSLLNQTLLDSIAIEPDPWTGIIIETRPIFDISSAQMELRQVARFHADNSILGSQDDKRCSSVVKGARGVSQNCLSNKAP
ncbi:hypothetical protein HNY73_000430 [Argiope bruennichi]|uniref:Uncharacterized protein n=1 Tax=Argiope bruennichi TaxID=94029 RepID=A0A8T0FY28_ARGBR|nr:hypothetical protein HNY73_000430 [Argiope bruennichi]